MHSTEIITTRECQRWEILAEKDNSFKLERAGRQRLFFSACCQLPILSDSYIILFRCLKELEPWRTPNTSRPIKKVGVMWAWWIGGGGGLFLYGFFNCMQKNSCFSFSSVLVSHLNRPGKNFRSRSHGDKRQNWCNRQICSVLTDPYWCCFEHQRMTH